MAFTLLYNLYIHIKQKTEKRITIAFVGLDGAGKVSRHAVLTSQTAHSLLTSGVDHYSEAA